MRKTEEEATGNKTTREILYETILSPKNSDKDIQTVTFEAMQTYANQEKEAESIGFGLWLLGNCDQSAICWYYEGEQMTTAQLYAIYLKNKF